MSAVDIVCHLPLTKRYLAAYPFHLSADRALRGANLVLMAGPALQCPEIAAHLDQCFHFTLKEGAPLFGTGQGRGTCHPADGVTRIVIDKMHRSFTKKIRPTLRNGASF